MKYYKLEEYKEHFVWELEDEVDPKSAIPEGFKEISEKEYNEIQLANDPIKLKIK